MSFYKWLNERVYATYETIGKDYPVYFNPTPDELTSFGMRNIRGLLDGDDIFIWDENVSNHKRMQEFLGLAQNRGFYIHLKSDGTYHIGPASYALSRFGNNVSAEDVKRNPAIIRMLSGSRYTVF